MWLRTFRSVLIRRVWWSDPRSWNRCRVGEQLPDDDQDGAGDRDQGFEFAAAFDDARVAFAQGGLVFAAAAAASPSAP